MNDYKGYCELELDDAELSEIYTHSRLNGYLFHENEYLLVKAPDGEIIDEFCYQGGQLRKVKYVTCNNVYCGTVKPRNPQQKLAMDMLADKSTKVKVVRGVYGSGKDYLMLNMALDLIQKNKFDKIVYVRPNVTVKGLPDIGYLKGTVWEKLSWTFGPIADKVGGDQGVDFLVSEGKLEVMPLLFIRGRSFDNSIVYMSEGQNMNTEIAKLLLGRIGENSELWINGDTHQTDKDLFEKDNGIDKMIERLRDNELFSYVYLPKTERSAVANLANLLD